MAIKLSVSHDNDVVAFLTIKQLLTDVDIRHAARGLIVTTSTLTAPARLLVKSFRHRLSHIEGDELRERLIRFRANDS